MAKPVEEMTLEEIRQRLDLMNRAYMIDHTASIELLAIANRLARDASMRAPEMPKDDTDDEGPIL